MFNRKGRCIIERLKRLAIKQLCWCIQYLGRETSEMTCEDSRRVLYDYYPNAKASCFIPNERHWNPMYDCTVIVASYNAERYIAECLDSIRRQRTMFSVQVVVVDDGSTDSTRSLLDAYKAINHWTIVYQSN